MSRTEYIRTWRAKNPEKVRAITTRQVDKRRTQRHARGLLPRGGSLKKPRVEGDNRTAQQRWREENLGRAASHSAAYRNRKIQRTPLWADLKKIEQVYVEAQSMTLMMGEPWHVDHVIPLRGRRVSGLHVHTNLQLLPGAENVKKGSKYEA